MIEDLSGPWPFIIVLAVMTGLMIWGVVHTRRVEREADEATRCQHEESDYNSVTDEWVCRSCGYRSTEVPHA